MAANLLAADAPRAGGQVLNVATGEQQSLNDLVATLNQLLGTDVPAVHADPRAGDVLQSWADVGQAHDVLGYRPEIGFEDGLRATIKAFEQLELGGIVAARA